MLLDITSLIHPFTLLLTMAPHAGVIIAASVLVAASLAAYENPQIREWIEKSSQKVALAFRALGDDIHGRNRSRRPDTSMHEEEDEKAEERRRAARHEIMEKGRVLQEKKKRPQSDSSRTPSFDSLVDEDGKLRDSPAEANPWAASSGLDREETTGLRARHDLSRTHESVDSLTASRQLDTAHQETPTVPAIEPWESQYEQEMRNAWNIRLPTNDAHGSSSHLSESLIDMTPTTEDFPDPDYSIPSLNQADYFPNDTHQNLDQREANSSVPSEPSQSGAATSEFQSAHASVASSTVDIGRSEADLTDDDDDMSDEFGDGIRTPASVWTEVGSSVSGDELS